MSSYAADGAGTIEGQAMKKLAVGFVVLWAMSGAGSAGAQLYVPIPLTTGENRFQVLLTNLGAKTTSFHSRIYFPERAPQREGRFDLPPGGTVMQEYAGTPGGFKVVQAALPGVMGSARLTGPDGSVVRGLPVFTSRDVVPKGKKATFQFVSLPPSPEPVSLVVLSVNETDATCSVTYDSVESNGSVAFTVPQSAAVSTLEVPGDGAFLVAQVTCNRPFLVFAYRGTAPTAEIVEPSVPE